MRGFTLVEILMVVIILGIMASLALPKVIQSNEMILSAEGRRDLEVLLSAQKIYALENTGSYAASAGSLDFTIPNPKYFIVSVANVQSAVAAVTRTDNTYTLCISDVAGSSGIITCHSGTDCAVKANDATDCAQLHCNKGGGTQCNI